MPKANPKQIKQIVDWAALGMSDKEIAEKLGWTNKTAARSVARYRKQQLEQEAVEEKVARTLDELSRDERYQYLQNTLEQMPRVRLVFDTFDAEEKATFQDEYFRIVKSTDSLTEAEEQTLFTSVLSYVLAMRALKRKSQEEKYYEATMEGLIDEGDPNFRRTVDDRFQKEYESHMKKHTECMRQLKMSREQRLDKVKSERRSLVDVAEELSTKTAQADAANRIEELSRLKDEELKRLIEAGHLYGEFSE